MNYHERIKALAKFRLQNYIKFPNIPCFLTENFSVWDLEKQEGGCVVVAHPP